MQIRVHFYSFFKDLAGCAETTETVTPDSTIDALLKQVIAHFPKLGGMQGATLIAVGVEYQDRSYVLQAGDEVSLFPPVQGG